MDKQLIKLVARAIWNIRRDNEDRCDMELEDIPISHSVWKEAEAAVVCIDAEHRAEIERLKSERDEYNSAWQHAGEEYRKLRDSLLSLAGAFK